MLVHDAGLAVAADRRRDVIMHRAFLSLILAHAIFSPALAAVDSSARVRDCRDERVRADPRSGYDSLVFPDADVFTPPIADQKEPRLSLGYDGVRFFDQALPSGGAQDTIHTGVVSAGGILGVWALRHVEQCRGIQVSLMGGVFSQFNLDAPSRDLINSDFVVGGQATVRQDRLSARVRVYHQSSHLGDEFVLRHPSIVREDFGFQALDALVSLDAAWWRVYAGGGYRFYRHRTIEPWVVQGGLELRGRESDRTRVIPVVGVDITTLQARDWGATTSIAAGLEWTSAASTRRMRAVMVFLNGFTPFGQFSNQQEQRSLGLQFQIEF